MCAGTCFCDLLWSPALLCKPKFQVEKLDVCNRSTYLGDSPAFAIWSNRVYIQIGFYQRETEREIYLCVLFIYIRLCQMPKDRINENQQHKWYAEA